MNMTNERSWDIRGLPLRELLSRHLWGIATAVEETFVAENHRAKYKIDHKHMRVERMDEPAISPEEELALLVNSQIIQKLKQTIAECHSLLSTLSSDET